MPKYADPAVYTVGTPGSTDLVMTRKADASDGNFALGNLAGIAPVTVANDQALTYTGGAWASYSLTAAGRALSGVAGTANTFPYFSAANVVTLGSVTATGLSVLSAASQAAARAAIQAVGTIGDESIDGIKTLTARPVFGAGAALALNQRFVCLVSGSGSTPGMRGASAGELVLAAGANSIFLRPGGDTVTAGQVEITSSGTFRAAGSVTPTTDNANSLGFSSNRWTTVFATNATINTSDARLKTEPRQLRDAEFKAASAIARLPAVWRWLNRVHGDENCEPEGREARKHFGPTVQAAIAVMEANGLDPFAYSFICYDEWDAEEATYDEDGNELTPAREAGDRYSFRKEELLCFIVRALAQEIDGLSERVAALEAKT